MSSAELSSTGTVVIVHTFGQIIVQHSDVGIGLLYGLLFCINGGLFVYSLKFAVEQIRDDEQDDYNDWGGDNYGN